MIIVSELLNLLLEITFHKLYLFFVILHYFLVIRSDQLHVSLAVFFLFDHALLRPLELNDLLLELLKLGLCRLLDLKVATSGLLKLLEQRITLLLLMLVISGKVRVILLDRLKIILDFFNL